MNDLERLQGFISQTFGSGAIPATAAQGALADTALQSVPTASAGTLGVIKVGSGLTITDGVLSVSGGSYTLPIAQIGTLGGIQPSDEILVNASTGVATVNASDEGTDSDAGKVVKYGSSGRIVTTGSNATLSTTGANATIFTEGSGATISTSGESATISTSGESATISTSGVTATISTSGTNAPIFTTGSDSNIYTTGENSAISTEGLNAPIYTLGANAYISTSGASAYIQTRANFRLSDGTNVTTIAHSVSGSYTLTFTPTANATLTIGASTTLSGGTHSGTNTGDETVTTIASKLNAGTEDTSAADSDKIAVTSPAGGWMSLTTLWTWITGKLSAAFYRPLIVKKSSAQIDVTSSTTFVNITGLTGYALEANSTYRVEFFGEVTAGAAGGYKIAITSTQAFKHTTSGTQGLGGFWPTGGTAGAPFQLSSTQIQINSRTAASTALPVVTIAIVTTGSNAAVVDFQFAQNASSGTTSSLLTGAVGSFTKLI